MDDTKNSDLGRIRDSYPFFLVGNAGDCKQLWVKVDAGWHRNYETALGWVAYDENGCRIFEGGLKIKAESALQAEAMGIQKVLIWACERDILHLDLSSDYLQLVTQLAGLARPNHLIGGLMEDIFRIGARFHCLCFSYLPRKLNKIAHSLACEAMRL
ncbi:uncharacterized protein LOC141595546 [Silene latifolia]|uniref:uncharacterized protein LOC141595546 n=1 Tax=Silene latifolia TaxID=37657 RepID=UPI003D78AC35